jgi:hypothetical protein
MPRLMPCLWESCNQGAETNLGMCDREMMVEGGITAKTFCVEPRTLVCYTSYLTFMFIR